MHVIKILRFNWSAVFDSFCYQKAALNTAEFYSFHIQVCCTCVTAISLLYQPLHTCVTAISLYQPQEVSKSFNVSDELQFDSEFHARRSANLDQTLRRNYLQKTSYISQSISKKNNNNWLYDDIGADLQRQ